MKIGLVLFQKSQRLNERNERTKEATNKQTNLRDDSQYLLESQVARLTVELVVNVEI